MNLHLRQVAAVHEVLGGDHERTLQRHDSDLVAAVQTDLEQIHLSGRQLLVRVDVSEAPRDRRKDGQDVSLGRQGGSVTKALLLESGIQSLLPHDLGRVVKGTRQSLPARHLLPALGSAKVDLHAGMELAQRSVEELAGRVGAAVRCGTLVDLGSGGKLTLQEGRDGLGHDVGDEEGSALLDDLGPRRVVHKLVAPVLLGIAKVEGDEVVEDDVLVGGVGVRVPDGSDLVHGAVEEGGVHLGEEGLNCSHFCSHEKTVGCGGCGCRKTATISVGRMSDNQLFLIKTRQGRHARQDQMVV